MKNKYLLFLLCSLLIFCFIGCNKQVADNNTPTESAKKFLDALQDQNFSAAKAVYAENMDNLNQFKNKIEDISPTLANKLFDKMFGFEYIINKVELDPEDSNKATVSINIEAYDLGKTFENIIGEYLQTDLKMSFDGATDDEIVKKAEEVVIKDLEKAEKNFFATVDMHLTKENEEWKVDKIGNNSDLINALSGNIIKTIDKLNETLENTQ